MITEVLTIDAVLKAGPVVPVVVIPDESAAVPLARALLAGGIKVIEVTLRTPAAAAAIRNISRDVPEIVVGAGTVASKADVETAVESGARFLVMPGSPDYLLDAVSEAELPYLPAATTLTDMLRVRERGLHAIKFFPAEASGGPKFLAAVAGPTPDLTFCPTGGIDAGNAAEYLALPNVVCVGGSWLTPTAALDAHDWKHITERARAASQLVNTNA